MTTVQKRRSGKARRYWVVGGEYRDPNRYETVIGEEIWLGPFGRKAEAMKVWKEWAWRTVDHAQIRYRVVQGEGPARVDAAAQAAQG